MSEDGTGNSVFWAAVSLAKLSIGNGILALPFAFVNGGLLFSPIGIVFVAVWNVISCFMMIRCKQSCDDFIYPRGVSSSYSRIAFSALGWPGVVVTDCSLVVTLLGVCASYQIAFAEFLKDIPYNPLASYPESMQLQIFIYLSALAAFPLSCAKNLSYLSKTSFFGLACLFVSIIILIAFGIHSIHDKDTSSFPNSTAELSLWPTSASSLTTFMGISIFCFGICTFAFPVEESMADKKQFPQAVYWSMIIVCTFYVLMGDLITMVYAYDDKGIQENILENLPEYSLTSSAVRFALAMVCLVSYPLTLFPPAQILEHMIMQMASYLSASGVGMGRDVPDDAPGAIVTITSPSWLHSYGAIPRTDNETSASNEQKVYHPHHVDEFEEPSVLTRCVDRAVLVMLTTILAAHVPCFGLIVSLLGSFTVTILSFVLPPALHLQLVVMPQLAEEERYRRERCLTATSSAGSRNSRVHGSQYTNHHNITQTHNDDPEEASDGSWVAFTWIFGDRVKTKVGTLQVQYVADILMTIMGCCVCIFTTSLTADDAYRNMIH